MALMALPDLLLHRRSRHLLPLIILPRRHPFMMPFRPRHIMAQSGWEGLTTTGTAAGAGAMGITGIRNRRSSRGRDNLPRVSFGLLEDRHVADRKSEPGQEDGDEGMRDRLG